jgi:uncharacterized protein (TIGR02246 family)
MRTNGGDALLHRIGETMKRLLMLVSVAFLLCPGCQQGKNVLGELKTDAEADIKAIKAVVEEINVAMNSSDVDRYLQHYADDAVEIRPNEPALTGKDAIRSRHRQEFDEVTLQDVYTLQDVMVSGNLAVARLIWSSTITLKSGGEPFKANGNWLMVFEKQPDNIWKISYSIWSDENLIHPNQPEL